MTNYVIKALDDERAALIRACELDLEAAPTHERLSRVESRTARVREIDGKMRQLRATTVPSTDSSENAAGKALAGELRNITGGGSSTGLPFTPTDWNTTVFQGLFPASTVLASGARVIPTTRDTVYLPKVSALPSSAVVAEGATITESDITAAQLQATPFKFAAITAITNEAVQDSNPAILDVAANALVRSLALRMDAAFIEGAGSTEPTGLKNVAGISTVSSGTNGATPTNVNVFLDAVGQLLQNNSTGQPAIFMHARTWQTVSKLIDGINRPLVMDGLQGTFERRLLGAPVYITNQMSITETQGTSTNCSSAYVVDPQQLVVVMRQETRLEVDRSRLFNADMTEIRAIARADMVVPNPAAVVRITGIKP